jgi:hypothetical protein
MFPEMVLVWLPAELVKELIAEQQPFFRFVFFAQGLFQNPAHKGSVAGRLFFRIDLAEDGAKLRMSLQGIAKIAIDERIVDAWSGAVHQWYFRPG